MDYLNSKNENIFTTTFSTLKERSRANILSLGYDFIDFKRNFRKNLNRLKYRLPSITLNF